MIPMTAGKELEGTSTPTTISSDKQAKQLGEGPFTLIYWRLTPSDALAPAQKWGVRVALLLSFPFDSALKEPAQRYRHAPWQR